MNDQLIQNVESVVEGIFKKKEEAEMKKETEAVLSQATETIVQLNASLEAKDKEHLTELSKLQETIAALEIQLNTIADAKKALEDEKAKFEEYKIKFEEEKSNLIKRAEVAELEIENTKKDQVAASRMSELESAGVSSTDKASQLSKVREMSVEDFDAYKTELISIREAVVAQLKIEEPSNPDKATVNDAQDLLNAANDVDTSIDPLKAAAAAINMELDTSTDILSKYRELGSQLATNMKSKK
jgi:hypothetical protein